MMRALLILLLAAPAWAADHCREEPGSVICTKDGFDKLIERCRGFQYDAQECGLRLSAANEEVVSLQAALKRCNPTTCPPPKVQSGDRQRWGFVLGIVGAAAAVAAPFLPQTGVAGQALIVGGGVLSMGAGFVLTTSFE